MNNLKRNLKIFFLFSKFSLKTTFQGKMGPIFFMFGKTLRFLLLFALIFLIFSRTKLVKGYNLNQVVVFYLTFNLVDTIAQIFFREVYRFRWLVTSGNLDLVLTKPHHPFLRVLIGGVDYLDLVMLIPYVIFTLIFMSQSQTGNQLSNIIIYLLLIINSLIIATAFHIIVLALGILTTEVDHTIMIYRDLTALGRFPIDIYQTPIKEFFTFVIPIAVMMSFPVKAFYHLLNWDLIIYAFVFSGAIFLLSLRLWGRALRKYQSWGG